MTRPSGLTGARPWTARTLSSSAPWLHCAPFGVPVVPEV
jgi:hypothetical protein